MSYPEKIKEAVISQNDFKRAKKVLRYFRSQVPFSTSKSLRREASSLAVLIEDCKILKMAAGLIVALWNQKSEENLEGIEGFISCLTRKKRELLDIVEKNIEYAR